jgi:hypothetical protein
MQEHVSYTSPHTREVLIKDQHFTQREQVQDWYQRSTERGDKPEHGGMNRDGWKQ